MKLRVNSNKNIFDHAEAFISFAVTIDLWPCTPGFTAPVIDPLYVYYIKTPPETMTIPLTGLANGDCEFSATLTPVLDPVADVMFTYTPEVVPVDAVIDTKFSTQSVPMLTISTSDISKEMTRSYTVTATSLAPLDSTVVAYTINF